MRLAGAIAAALLALSLLATASPRADEVHMPEMVPPPSRDVTPSGVTPAPITSGPLIREPLPPAPPEKASWHRFFLPQTTDAATFVADNRTIRLAGVSAVERDVDCKLADGSQWPCGTTALFALRRFLQGRAVECYLLMSDKTNPVSAPCRVGTTDVALWLLTEGWVTAQKSASDAYRKAATAARCEGLGLWRGAAKDPSCPHQPPVIPAKAGTQ